MYIFHFFGRFRSAKEAERLEEIAKSKGIFYRDNIIKNLLNIILYITDKKSLFYKFLKILYGSITLWPYLIYRGTFIYYFFCIGEVLPTEKRFDSNCITPGTVFMARLHEQLKYFIKEKISRDPLWGKVKVILSGHEVSTLL